MKRSKKWTQLKYLHEKKVLKRAAKIYRMAQEVKKEIEEAKMAKLQVVTRVVNLPRKDV